MRRNHPQEAAGQRRGVRHQSYAEHDRGPLQVRGLKQEFKSGPEVTKACLSCHTEAAKQIQKTLHWRWIAPEDKEGKIGKAGIVVNNFCIAVPSNEPRCTSCHIGYGWKDKTFDLTAEERSRLPCLSRADRDLREISHHGRKSRVRTHPSPYHGNKTLHLPRNEQGGPERGLAYPTELRRRPLLRGGGEGVNHGDLDASMFKPNKALDVHMAMEDENFNCTRCHDHREGTIFRAAYYKLLGHG